MKDLVYSSQIVLKRNFFTLSSQLKFVSGMASGEKLGGRLWPITEAVVERKATKKTKKNGFTLIVFLADKCLKSKKKFRLIKY
jgi:hypothetical protein